MPTARRALRACVEPLLGYGAAVVASLGLMALVVVALLVESGGGGGDDVTGDLDVEAVGTLVGMPFQLAGMALGGSLTLGDSEFRVSLFAPPLWVTAVFAVVVFVLSRRAERTSPSASALERAVLAASGAVVVAVVATVATRLLAMRDDGEVMHAASAGLFFGVLTLAFVAALLGRAAASAVLWPRLLPADGRRAVHLVGQHVVVWMALVIPVATLWLMVDGGVEAGLYALVWGPTAALGAFGLGHLGAVTAFGEHQLAWELGWVPGVVLPLLAVLLVVTAATAWHLRRGQDRALLAHPGSWVTLPLAYALVGLLVCLLSTVGISGAFYGVGGGFTVHAAYWLIPVLVAWGAAIEALSRFVAPALANVLPAPVARRLARSPRQLSSAPLAPVQRIPMSPADKARARKALVGVGVVGGLGLLGVIVVSVLGSVMFAPEEKAEAYLDALVDADAAAALDLAPVDEDEAGAALLTDEVYGAAEDRITGYEITDVEELGETVSVTVDLEGIADGEGLELTLEADGRRALFFSDWKVTQGGLASAVTVPVPESSTSVAANGVAVPAQGGEDLELWALPGTYTFDPYGDSEWLETTAAPTTVTPATWGTYAEITTPEPSEALTSLVDSELAAWLDDCMASAEPDPAGCPQEVYPSGDTQRNLTWTLVSLPTVAWDGFDGTFPTELYSDTEGEATATYEYDASYGFGKPDWVEETESSSLYVDVTVDLVDDEPQVTFDSY